MFVKPIESRFTPGFGFGALPLSRQARIDWRNPINRGLGDCRLYDCPTTRNIAGAVTDNVALPPRVEKGYTGLDFSGSNDITVTVGSGFFNTYTKYVIVVPDTSNNNNLISGGSASDHAFWCTLGNFGAGHNGTYNQVTSAASIVTGQLYHVAVTYDGTNLRLYVDGVLDDTFTVSAPSGSGADVYIASYDGSFQLDGCLIFTGMWDRALSDQEIRALYKNEASIFEPSAEMQFLYSGAAAPVGPVFSSGLLLAGVGF